MAMRGPTADLLPGRVLAHAKHGHAWVNKTPDDAAQMLLECLHTFYLHQATIRLEHSLRILF